MSQGWISKENVTREAVEGFLSNYGRAFYKISDPNDIEVQKRPIRLERRGETIPRSISSSDGKLEVVPFRRGEDIMSLSWIKWPDQYSTWLSHLSLLPNTYRMGSMWLWSYQQLFIDLAVLYTIAEPSLIFCTIAILYQIQVSVSSILLKIFGAHSVRIPL